MAGDVVDRGEHRVSKSDKLCCCAAAAPGDVTLIDHLVDYSFDMGDPML